MLLPERNMLHAQVAGYLNHALHMLAEVLDPFLAEKTRDESPVENPDIASVLGMMDDDGNWERNFRSLGVEARGWIAEIRRAYDSQVHQGGYSDQDIHRALDSMRRLLAAVSANRQAAEVEQMCRRVGEFIYGGSTDGLHDVSVFMKWGDTHHRTDDYDAAIDDFTAAIRLNPEHAPAYFCLGQAHARNYDFDRAIEDFTKAIEFQPGWAEAYGNRGACYARNDDQTRAIKDFDRAIQLNPDHHLAYGSRGMARFRIGQYDEALQDMTKAISAYPKWAAPYNDRGRTFFQKESYDRAIQDFSKAIELLPQWGGAYSNRGRCYDAKKEFDSALQDYNTAIECRSNWDAATDADDGDAWRPTDIDDTVAAAYYRRGVVHFGKKDYDQAIADFTEALSLNPPDAPAYADIPGLGETHRISADSAAWFMRGRAYAKIGDYPRAIADLSRAIERDPDWEEPRYRRALLSQKQSVEDFSEAIRCDPFRAEAYYNRALLHEIQGKETEALFDYDQAIWHNPDYADAHYRRALIYEIQGMKDEAVDDYEAVLKIDSEHTKARRNLDRLQREHHDTE